MPIDPKSFRAVMGCFASGVTVVTTRQENGEPCGLTASAVTSVSLSPPMLLVCIDKNADSHRHFETAGAFGVNILTDRQIALSNRFAVSGGDKFSNVPFRWGTTNVPILEEHLAYIECRIAHAYAGGDHTIYVGEVEAAGTVEGRPLLYYRGAYGALGNAPHSS